MNEQFNDIDIKINGRFGSLKWYIKLAVFAAALLIIFIILALLSHYIGKDRLKELSQESGYIDGLDIEKNGYSLCQNKEGLLGVMSYGNQLIAPEWGSIGFLDSKRFAVSDSQTKLFGIIENDNDIVQPFIFTKLEPLGKKYLVGTVNDTEEKMLFSSSGDLLSFDVWKDIVYDESSKSLTFKAEGKEYICKIENEKLKYTNVNLSGKAAGTDISFQTENINASEDIPNNLLTEIFSKSCDQIGKIFSDADNDFFNTVVSENYDDTSESAVLENCKLLKVSNINIYALNNEETEYVFSADIEYSYSSDENSDSKAVIHTEFVFIHDLSMELILKNVDTEEK